MIFSTEQAIRLARIRAKIREGVWALRDNSALQAHWDAMERGELAGGAMPKSDVDATTVATPR